MAKGAAKPGAAKQAKPKGGKRNLKKIFMWSGLVAVILFGPKVIYTAVERCIISA